MILLIYGASGLAKEIYDLIQRSMPKRWEKILFIDDFRKEGSCYLSESVHFSSISKLFPNGYNELEGIVAIGEPSNREILYKRFIKSGIKMATIIDKTSYVSPTARIEEGTVICEMTTIHADVFIGKNVLIQPFCNIGHDIKIGNHSVLSSFAAPGGGDVFGERVYVGMQSSIKEKLNIGDDAIIGMGSAVFRDIETGTTVVGNPARQTIGNKEHRVFK